MNAIDCDECKNWKKTFPNGRYIVNKGIEYIQYDDIEFRDDGIYTVKKRAFVCEKCKKKINSMVIYNE